VEPGFCGAIWSAPAKGQEADVLIANTAEPLCSAPSRHCLILMPGQTASLFVQDAGNVAIIPTSRKVAELAADGSCPLVCLLEGEP
jgi:hypothetical protein